MVILESIFENCIEISEQFRKMCDKKWEMVTNTMLGNVNVLHFLSKFWLLYNSGHHSFLRPFIMKVISLLFIGIFLSIMSLDTCNFGILKISLKVAILQGLMLGLRQLCHLLWRWIASTSLSQNQHVLIWQTMAATKRVLELPAVKVYTLMTQSL